MGTSRRRQMALALATASIAVAGCGGGSSKKPSAAPAPAGTTGGTGTSSGGTLTPSTSVTSPAYRAALIRRISQINGVPAAEIPKIVDCVIKKELAQGIHTLADVSTHASEARTDGEQCAVAAGVH